MSVDAFKKTKIQNEATKVLAGDARHVLLRGGARSGKTFLAVRAIIIRASKVESRHVILRKTFNSVKTSVWHETIPKVMRLCFPDLTYKTNKTDYYLTLPNGSEIWCSGLDDDRRVEKILGKEYSTIYFNEVSQLSYAAIQIALTRLAEKNSLRKKVYYDCNPSEKTHFSYYLFMKKLDPRENVPLKKPENYATILMNPRDNIENLDPEYLEMLEALPEKERERFLNGEFTDHSDGVVYYEFNRDLHVRKIDYKEKTGRPMLGMDFNVNPMTCVIGYVCNEVFYVVDECFLENSDTPRMCTEIKKKGYTDGLIFPDSTGRARKTSGKSDFVMLQDAGFEIYGTKNPFVTDRVTNINRLLKDGRIIIDPNCKKLINDLEKVSWKDNKLDQKTDSMLTHISDALGYWCWALDNIVYNSRKSTQRTR